MKFNLRLSQRIILSFVLLTGIVSGLFAVGLITTIDFVEENLVTNELQKDFSRLLEDYRKGRELRLDEGEAFFPAGPDLPEYLCAIPEGYTEIVLKESDSAYHVFHQVEGTTSYFLVKDQTDFEKAEILLKRVVGGGFVLSVVASLVIGVVMVRQVIAPMRKLTEQVALREDLQSVPPSLASEYADDEVGALAKAFDATFIGLHQALVREALFTSDVSHELRTPLMVIQSTCEVLAAGKELDDHSRQKIEAIRRAVKDIKSLIEAFLALARGKDNQTETATLKAVVQEEFPNWERMAMRKGNRLLLLEETGSPAQREPLYPAVLLRTVMDNLVRNAVYHTAGGDIFLALKTGGFEVRDTGSGIAADEMQKVFQPDYRGPDSPREGLGLGLSLVQRICEREHWTVALEQNQPRGCCFRVNLA